MISSLDSSSPDLLHWNNHHHPSRLFHLPKSRSQLHHHHHHHHHQPSWSSSLSAFSLQRTSAFLIDEYGNEHDPEHCQFKTLAASPTRRSTSSSSSNRSIASSPSSRSPPSPRSSIRSLGPPSHFAPSISTPGSSYHPRPLQLLNRCLPSTPQPSTWSTLKTRQHPKIHHPFKQPKNCHSSPQLQPVDPHQDPNHHPSSRWTGKIWSHLLRPSSTSASQPASSIRSNRPSPVLRSPHGQCHLPSYIHSTPLVSPHTIFKKKRKLSFSRADHHQPRLQQRCDSPRSLHPVRSLSHHHLCGMRKRLELVKLEFRFGILRTRKRFVGVWKK